MTHIEQMVERHIREHEARLAHVDELLAKARSAEQPEIHAELDELMAERDRLATQVDELRLKSLDHWREEELALAGPMGIWDALAQQLEKLVERVIGR